MIAKRAARRLLKGHENSQQATVEKLLAAGWTYQLDGDKPDREGSLYMMLSTPRRVYTGRVAADGSVSAHLLGDYTSDKIDSLIEHAKPKPSRKNQPVPPIKAQFDKIAEEVRQLGVDYAQRYTTYGPKPKMKLWALSWATDAPDLPLDIHSDAPVGIAISDALHEHASDEGVIAGSSILGTLQEKYPEFSIEIQRGGGWQPWGATPIPSLVVRPKLARKAISANPAPSATQLRQHLIRLNRQNAMRGEGEFYLLRENEDGTYLLWGSRSGNIFQGSIAECDAKLRELYRQLPGAK